MLKELEAMKAALEILELFTKQVRGTRGSIDDNEMIFLKDAVGYMSQRCSIPKEKVYTVLKGFLKDFKNIDLLEVKVDKETANNMLVTLQNKLEEENNKIIAHLKDLYGV